MKIGVIKEIKTHEYRVALTPAGVAQLIHAGHRVLVQSGAGDGSHFSDQAYQQAGATIVTAEQAWSAELVVKVKEPLAEEYVFLQGQILFAFLHLAGVDKMLTTVLLNTKTTAIAYETVEDQQGQLPLLAPMSAIAGSMAVTMGNYFLAQFNHGRGMLLSEILGNRHGEVVIVGDGIVGQHAARVATGIGANVTLFGIDQARQAMIHQTISPAINYQLSSPGSVGQAVIQADLVVGAVLIRGQKAPFVVTKAMVKKMQPGAVIVDVSIDQGGCVETSRPTSHLDPVFQQYGVVHYCVTNMPGAYPKTSTLALTQATLPYIQKLADQGMRALQADKGFMKGVNTDQGKIVNPDVADNF